MNASTHLYQTDILSISDFKKETIQEILSVASDFKKQAPGKTLSGKIIASCFFEPSTRTRLSFESAAVRLGAQTIGFSSAEGSSIEKGESLSDTCKTLVHYADALILRHAREGASRLIAELIDKPIINAGDGTNQHPTQALIDLFTIQECQTRLEGLHIAFVGDLKYSRTIRSLVQACALFPMRLFFVSPLELSLSEALCDYLKYHAIRFSFHSNLEDILPKLDVIYMTRWQHERFSSTDYSLIKQKSIVTPAFLDHAKPNLAILHPLPRLTELDVTVDQTVHACYFTQAANGIPVRQALLSLVLLPP